MSGENLCFLVAGFKIAKVQQPPLPALLTDDVVVFILVQHKILYLCVVATQKPVVFVVVGHGIIKMPAVISCRCVRD